MSWAGSRRARFVIAGTVSVVVALPLPAVAIAGGPPPAPSGGTASAGCTAAEPVDLSPAGGVGDPASFGASVAVSADGLTALAGSPNRSADGLDGAGVVSVYTRPSVYAAWSAPSALPAPSQRVAGQGWGAGVALASDGLTALVSEWVGSSRESAVVAIWSSRRDAFGWTTPELVHTSPMPSTGSTPRAIALSGDGSVAVVGDADGGSGSGAVLTYRRTSQGWQPSQTLPLPAEASRVGDGVSVSRDGRVVAASGRSALQAPLVWTRASTDAVFGAATPLPFADDQGNVSVSTQAVALSGDGYTILADVGSEARLLTRSGTVWSPVTAFALPDGTFAHAGLALDAEGTRALVGADITGPGGEVTLYSVGQSGWTAAAGLSAPVDFGANGKFGFAVALSDGGAVLVGAPEAAGTGFDRSGGVVSWETCPPAPVTPGAPQDVLVTPGTGALLVSWEPPASDGGAVVLDYTVRLWDQSVGGTVATTQTAVGTTAAVSSPAGATRWVTVTARNAQGSGPESSPRVPGTAVAPPLVVPGPPLSLTVTSRPASLAVAWSPPASDGGASISRYDVVALDRSSGTAVSAGTCRTSETACTLGGLVDGSSYDVEVTATNSVGTGPAARASGTPFAATGARGVVVRAADSAIQVLWASPAAPPAGQVFVARAWSAAVAGSVVGICSSLVNRCVINPLTNGTAYYVDVVIAPGSSTSPPGSGPTGPRLPATPTRLLPLSGPWRQVAAGPAHSCGLTTTGAVYCWGASIYGEVGTPPHTTRYLPTPVPRLRAGVTAVAVGSYHSCALTAGRVVCWGLGTSGQLGNGRFSSSTTPVAVAGLSGVTQITAGALHTCAMTSAGVSKGGRVYCWGSNAYGQLGTGAGASFAYARPFRTTAGTVLALSVSSGGFTACAVTTARTVLCAGRNDRGQLGAGASTRVVSRYAIAVRGLSGVRTLSVGGQGACAVTMTGLLYCWGDNTDNQLAGATRASLSVVPLRIRVVTTRSVAVGGYGNVCALSTTSAVWCWGHSDQVFSGQRWVPVTISRPTAVPALPGGVASISAGVRNCAVKALGAAVCWGLPTSNHEAEGSGSWRMGGRVPVPVTIS